MAFFVLSNEQHVFFFRCPASLFPLIRVFAVDNRRFCPTLSVFILSDLKAYLELKLLCGGTEIIFS